MKMHRIVVLPGDGIGPEVTRVAVQVLERVAARFDIPIEHESADIGGVAIRRHDDPLPRATLDLARAADAVLLGAVGDPEVAGARRRPEAALL